MGTLSAFEARSGLSVLLEPDDEELLAAYRAGDASAMRELVERYEEVVRGPLSWLVENTDDCEEAVAETFISLINARSRAPLRDGLKVWLTRTAIEKGAAWRRAHAEERARQTSRLRELRRVGSPRPQDVAAALSELPTRLFVPLMLRFLEDRPVSEVSAITRKSKRQVYTAICRGLEGLRENPPTADRRRWRGLAGRCDRVRVLMMLDSALDPRERHSTAEHIARCEECGSYEWRISALLAFLSALAAMRGRRSRGDDTWDRICRDRQPKADEDQAGPLLRRAGFAVTAMAAVAVLLALVALAQELWSRPVPPKATPEPAVAPVLARAAPSADSRLILPEFSGVPSGRRSAALVPLDPPLVAEPPSGTDAAEPSGDIAGPRAGIRLRPPSVARSIPPASMLPRTGPQRPVLLSILESLSSTPEGTSALGPEEEWTRIVEQTDYRGTIARLLDRVIGLSERTGLTGRSH